MSKAVVCNSSPIIALSIIKRLDLLWGIFDEIYITEAVYKEITIDEKADKIGAEELRYAIENNYIKIYSIKNKDLVEQLYGRLHRGELEVMIAAKELKIRRVIIDDRSARHFAETMLLKTIGIVGILLLAKDYKKIESVKAYLDLLIENGFRISLKLYNQVLNSAGELG
jgi:predicted nucleic acid-binding protein